MENFEGLKKCMPAILTALGIIGVGATAYFTGRATIKSVHEVEEAEKEKGEALTTKEKVKLCGKNYVVPAVTGIAAAASIGGSAWMSKKREISLIGAATLANGAYTKYKKSINEAIDKVLPEDIKKEFLGEAHKNELEEYKKDPVPQQVKLMPIHDGEKFACTFRKSDFIFETTYEQLLELQLFIRDQLDHEGYISYKEMYNYIDVYDHLPSNCENIGLDIDRLVEDDYNGCIQFSYACKYAGDVNVLEISFVGTVQGYDGITIDPIDGIPYDIDHRRLETFDADVLA